MYSSIFIYLFIWEPEECSQSAQQVCNGLDNQGSRFNAWQQQELFSKATRLAPGFWTRPVSHSVGIRTLSQGEKTSEHEADNSPSPLPTLPRCIPQPTSCLQGMYKQHYSIFTPYFYFITWVWKLGCNLHTSFCKIPQTHYTFLFYVHMNTHAQYMAKRSTEPCNDHTQSFKNSVGWYHIFEWYNSFCWNQVKYMRNKPTVKTPTKDPVWFTTIWL